MMQWIKNIALVLLGALAGYWLAGAAPAGAPVPLVSSATPAAEAIGQQVGSVPTDTKPAQQGSAKTAAASTQAVAATTEVLTLPDGLSFTLNKTELPDFFVPDAKPLSADNYQQALQQLSREDAALYAQLNDSLYGLLEYDNPQDYQRLLQHGLPTPQELRYVYSKPLSQLRKEMRALINQMYDLIDAQGIAYQSDALYRINALIKNRVIDELVSEYKQYNPAYKDGDPMPKEAHWPSHLQELYRELHLAYSPPSAPDNVVNLIAKFKIESRIGTERMPSDDVAVYLGFINQYSPHVVKRYIEQHPITEQQKNLSILVSNIR